MAAVREVVKDYGGKMADPGSIMFKFRRARVVNIKVTDADKDQLFNIALDAGADDVIEPPMDEDDTEEDRSERYQPIEIYCHGEDNIFINFFHHSSFFVFLPLFNSIKIICWVCYVR